VEVDERFKGVLRMCTDSRFSYLYLIYAIMCVISMSNPEYTLGNNAVSNGIFKHGCIISIF